MTRCCDANATTGFQAGQGDQRFPCAVAIGDSGQGIRIAIARLLGRYGSQILQLTIGEYQIDQMVTPADAVPSVTPRIGFLPKP